MIEDTIAKAKQSPEALIDAWVDNETFRRVLIRGGVKRKDGSIFSISKGEQLAFFKLALESEDLEIIETLWEDNKYISSYLLSEHLSNEDKIEFFRLALVAKVPDVIAALWQNHASISSFIGANSLPVYTQMAYFLLATRSQYRPLIKEIWNLTPALKLTLMKCDVNSFIYFMRAVLDNKFRFINSKMLGLAFYKINQLNIDEAITIMTFLLENINSQNDYYIKKILAQADSLINEYQQQNAIPTELLTLMLTYLNAAIRTNYLNTSYTNNVINRFFHTLTNTMAEVEIVPFLKELMHLLATLHQEKQDISLFSNIWQVTRVILPEKLAKLPEETQIELLEDILLISQKNPAPQDSIYSFVLDCIKAIISPAVLSEVLKNSASFSQIDIQAIQAQQTEINKTPALEAPAQTFQPAAVSELKPPDPRFTILPTN